MCLKNLTLTMLIKLKIGSAMASGLHSDPGLNSIHATGLFLYTLKLTETGGIKRNEYHQIVNKQKVDDLFM